jgi:hypothetical protein
LIETDCIVTTGTSDTKQRTWFVVKVGIDILEESDCLSLRCERAREKPIKHIDIGSQVSALAILSTTTPITFVDIRPPRLTVSNFFVIEGSLSKLPFETGSVQSLSCLHVVEHIGLGRYGDPIDAQGTEKACSELERVLAASGTLYLSVPVGKPRIEFNAHRVLSPHAVVELFPYCELIDYSFVDDKGMLHANIPPNAAAQSHYACGMFRFKKRGERNS